MKEYKELQNQIVEEAIYKPKVKVHDIKSKMKLFLLKKSKKSLNVSQFTINRKKEIH